MTLDVVGLGAAVVMGALLLFLGGSYGPFMLLLVLVFLVASALVTGMEKEHKERMKAYEKRRGWKNVLANGLVPLAIAAIVFADAHLRLGIPAAALVFAYAGSAAAITADKFSSEIGILDGRAIMLFTLRKIRAGISGGVSVLGTMAGALGTVIIGTAAGLYQWLVYGNSYTVAQASAIVLVVLASGMAGDFMDSFLGYFEEEGVGNKYTSNFAGAVVGGIVGFLLFLLLHRM